MTVINKVIILVVTLKQKNIFRLFDEGRVIFQAQVNLKLKLYWIITTIKMKKGILMKGLF